MTDSEKLDLLISEIQGVKDEIQGVKDEMQGMKGEMQGMKDGIQKLDQKVRKIELVIENELRDNIRRIAEGHLDLSRNLHEAMKPGREAEILAVRVSILETEVKELKEKIS